MEQDGDLDLSLTARELRMAFGRISRRMRRLYTTAGPSSDSSFLQLAVLWRLDRDGPASSAALAGTERVTPQAIGSALTDLQQRGLVRRAADPADARRIITEITAAGRSTLHSREHAITDEMRRTLERSFGPEERARLAAVLPLLERLADDL